MGLVSPNIALFIFGGIIIISAIAAWYFANYASFDRGRFHVFIVVLTGLGVAVTFMFYYNVVQLQNQEQQLALLQQMSHIDDTLGKTLPSILREITPLVPNFVLSLYPLQGTGVQVNGAEGTGVQVNGAEGTGVPDQSPAAQMALITVCITIFYLWQDIVFTHQVLHHDMHAYTVTFLQWTNSSDLRRVWLTMKENFAPRTQVYIDLLFRYGKIPTPTIRAYQEAAQALLTDPQYQEALC